MRALRRHHEDRIRAKYRRVAERWAGVWGGDNHPVPCSRWEYVEKTAAKLAHHHKCPCWACKLPRYDRSKGTESL